MGGGGGLSQSSLKGNKTVLSQSMRITDKMRHCQEICFAVN